MANSNEAFESVDFSNLDEETDTDKIADIDIIQPHLSLPPPPPSSRRNTRERGVVIVEERPPDMSQDDNDAHQGNVANGILDKSPEPIPYDNNNSPYPGHKPDNQTHTVPESAVINAQTSQVVPQAPTNTNEAPSNSTPVQICYSKDTGNISVQTGQVTTTGADGTRYIATQQIAQQWDQDERKPLRKNRIRWIKVFSILACILFFPTGIPALYFAFRIQKEFEEGILRGNIDRAIKFAKRSQQLSILSAVLCIVVGALVVTLIERPQFQSHSFHRGTVTG